MARHPAARENRGQSLVSALVAITLVTASLLTVGQLMHINAGSESGTRSRERLGDLRRRMAGAQVNPTRWVELLQSASPAIASCLPAAPGAVAHCPSPAADEAGVAAIANGRQIASVPLVDLEGAVLAGTQSNPVYFGPDGAPCGGSACRAIRAEGYLLRDGNPGAVEFVAKFEPVAEANTPQGAVYARVAVGREWQRAVPGRAAQACNAFEIVDQVVNNNIHCKPLGLVSCADGQYMSGVAADGTPVCQPAPVAPPPTVPKTRFIELYCASGVRGTAWTYCGVPGLGSAKITSVGLIHKYSSHGCDVGDELTYVGSQVRVRDKCAALVQVTVVDP